MNGRRNPVFRESLGVIDGAMQILQGLWLLFKRDHWRVLKKAVICNFKEHSVSYIRKGKE